MSPTRVLLCGSGHAALFAEAVAASGGRYAVAGVLARGSDRSRALARALGVPLCRDARDLPAGVDVACHAVGDTAPGRALTRDLLARGVHVLEQHPKAPDALEEALGLAARRGVAYHVDAHFGDLAGAAHFAARCREVAAETAPLFATARCGPRTLYAALDLLGRALGGAAPLALDPAPVPGDAALAAARPGAVPVLAVGGTWSGTPLNIQCHTALSDDDDGADDLGGVAASVVFAPGALHLASAYGPTLWTYAVVAEGLHAGDPLCAIEGAGPTGYEGLLRARREACLRALDGLVAHAATGAVPAWQAPGFLLGVSRAFAAVQAAAGPAVARVLRARPR